VYIQKQVTIPEAMAIFKRENFLNIGKKRNTQTIKSAEKCKIRALICVKNGTFWTVFENGQFLTVLL
jgi:hypothetical protein